MNLDMSLEVLSEEMKALREHTHAFFDSIENGDLVRVRLRNLHWIVPTSTGYEVGPVSTEEDARSHSDQARGVRRAGSITGYFCSNHPASKLERWSPRGFASLLDLPGNYITLAPFDDCPCIDYLGGTRIPLNLVAHYENIRKQAGDQSLASTRVLLRAPRWPDHDARHNVSGEINWFGED